MSEITRLQFKNDTEENWQILDAYDLLLPDAPEAAIPLTGEYAISIGNEKLNIYCGVKEEIQWFDSFNIFKGPKLNNNKILTYRNKEETDIILESGDTFIWKEQEQSFKPEISSIVLIFSVNKKGILKWNQSLQDWQIDENYFIIQTKKIDSESSTPEIPIISFADTVDSGIYNSDLTPPSFEGQSLTFGNSLT